MTQEMREEMAAVMRDNLPPIEQVEQMIAHDIKVLEPLIDAWLALRKVFVVSHDQGVDGGRAVRAYATKEAAIAYVENLRETQFPRLKRDPERLVWDSLGDTFLVDEFSVE